MEKTTPPPDVQMPDYTVEQALQECFLTREELTNLLDLFRYRKNLILEGPPGVGKSFVAKRLAWLLLGKKDNTRIENTQFHQSSSYEDLVRGYRPDGNGGFVLKDGLFYEFCERARADLDHDYVFVIDEINRGNLSKVFGELLLLIEADKRTPEWGISLNYRMEGDTERFWVPPNVHILGMMNTADRSLAMVDYALRRRFAFYLMRPALDHALFGAQLSAAGMSSDDLATLRTRIAVLNKQIEDDRDLGEGFLVGHSFFCLPRDGTTPDKAWYERIIQYEIGPLLREYWFDKPRDELTKIVARLAL